MKPEGISCSYRLAGGGAGGGGGCGAVGCSVFQGARRSEVQAESASTTSVKTAEILGSRFKEGAGRIRANMKKKDKRQVLRSRLALRKLRLRAMHLCTCQQRGDGTRRNRTEHERGLPCCRFGLNVREARLDQQWLPSDDGQTRLPGWQKLRMVGGCAKADKESLLLMLQHQRGLLADRRRELLRDLGEQPGQRDFQAHVVVGDIEDAGRSLAERANIEGEPIAGPGLLVERHEGGIVGARGGKAGLDAARRFLAAEPMRNGYDQRLRHDCLLVAVCAPDINRSTTEAATTCRAPERPPKR